MNFLQNLGSTEWLIIICILVLVFGKKKIMEWAKGLGESGREMQKVKKEFEGALTSEIDATPRIKENPIKKGE